MVEQTSTSSTAFPCNGIKNTLLCIHAVVLHVGWTSQRFSGLGSFAKLFLQCWVTLPDEHQKSRSSYHLERKETFKRRKWTGEGRCATAGVGKQAYGSPAYWINCSGKVHPCEGISSFQCQDQGKLESAVGEVLVVWDRSRWRFVLTGTRPSLKDVPICFHGFLGCASPVWSSQVLVFVLCMIHAAIWALNIFKNT